MLSWRLWQTITEPITRNPIFIRVRNENSLRIVPKTEVNISRYVYWVILIFAVLLFIRMPHLLIIVAQIPALLIMMIVLLPLMLPVLMLLVGSYLVIKITSNIHKEKRQYTYELLCASPDGSLYTNWAFATGILHRGTWFSWFKFGIRFASRIAQIFFVVMGILVISLVTSTEANVNRFEPIYTFINLTLLVVLYFTSLSQPIVISLVIGLYATSLNLSRRDSNIIGLMTYLIFQIIPYIVALILFVALTTIHNPPALLVIGRDIIILSTIFIVRELTLNLIWSQLTQLLNSPSDYRTLSPQIASTHR